MKPKGSYAPEVFRSTFAVQPVASTDGAPAPNTFRGMASVYNTLIDAWMPTRILPGAFSRTLNDPAAKARIRILYQHDQCRPIGVPTQLLETALGLEVEGKISDTADGRDCLTLMRDGVITELSIGFEPREQIFVKHPITGIEERHILDLDLFEFSPVTFAANRDAKVMSVHAMARGLLGGAALPDGAPLAALEPLTVALRTFAEEHAKARTLTPKEKALLDANLAALTAASAALALLAGAEPPADPAPASVADAPAPTPAAVVNADPTVASFDPAAALREIDLSALEAGVDVDALTPTP